MSSTFVVSEIRSDGKFPLGELNDGELYVGREENPAHKHLVVASEAVSREHGRFISIRGHWFYQDLGSTNGSWVNGVPVRQGQWKLLRSGDVIQLADRAVQLSALTPTESGHASLLVFLRGQFLEEYPIPHDGRALSIGGQKSDLKFDVDLNENPSVILERRPDRLVVTKVAHNVPMYLNEREVQGLNSLRDRDEVLVATYLVIVNDVNLQVLVPAVASEPRVSDSAILPKTPVQIVAPPSRTDSQVDSPAPSELGEINPATVSSTQTFHAADIQARLMSQRKEGFGMTDGLRSTSSMGAKSTRGSEEESVSRIITFVVRVVLMTVFILMFYFLILRRP